MSASSWVFFSRLYWDSFAKFGPQHCSNVYSANSRQLGATVALNDNEHEQNH
jgi:hypothetical protein